MSIAEIIKLRCCQLLEGAGKDRQDRNWSIIRRVCLTALRFIYWANVRLLPITWKSSLIYAQVKNPSYYWCKDRC